MSRLHTILPNRKKKSKKWAKEIIQQNIGGIKTQNALLNHEISKTWHFPPTDRYENI